MSTPKDKKSKSEAKTPAKIQNTEKAELSTETVVVEKAEAQKPRKSKFQFNNFNVNLLFSK